MGRRKEGGTGDRDRMDGTGTETGWTRQAGVGTGRGVTGRHCNNSSCCISGQFSCSAASVCTPPHLPPSLCIPLSLPSSPGENAFTPPSLPPWPCLFFFSQPACHHLPLPGFGSLPPARLYHHLPIPHFPVQMVCIETFYYGSSSTQSFLPHMPGWCPSAGSSRQARSSTSRAARMLLLPLLILSHAPPTFCPFHCTCMVFHA